MTVATIERVTILEPIVEPDYEEIKCIRAEVAARPRPKASADPCLIGGVSAGFSNEPQSEFQDSMDAAGYPYW